MVVDTVITRNRLYPVTSELPKDTLKRNMLKLFDIYDGKSGDTIRPRQKIRQPRVRDEINQLFDGK